MSKRPFFNTYKHTPSKTQAVQPCTRAAAANAQCYFDAEETAMGRKYIDCREFPSDMKCSLALSADTEEELLEAAVQHAIAVHQHKDTPEFREQLKACFKDGTPNA